MKYSAIMLFIVGWMLLVYFPLAHMVWGSDGLMNGLGNAKASIRPSTLPAARFVHMSSGWSALLVGCHSRAVARAGATDRSCLTAWC